MQDNNAQKWEQYITLENFVLRRVRGKESTIAEYCRRAIDSGHQACIWLCIKRGRKYSLVDMPLKVDEKTLGLEDVRKRYSWWKRHSLYSPMQVKEIMAHAMECDEKTQRISATITEYDVTEIVAKLDRAKEEALDGGIECGACDMDIEGRRHGDEVHCANTAYGTDLKEYCTVKHLDYLHISRDKYKWLSSHLEYYWQNGIDAKGMIYLQEVGFIYSYNSLIYDEWSDAANPYGKTINAFLVIEGWNITLLLKLIGVCVVLSLCIVVVVTAACHSLEIGLTAGAYAASLLAVLLATFAFLSGVM